MQPYPEIDNENQLASHECEVKSAVLVSISGCTQEPS